VILFVNGAFGIGKTTVARLVVARLPRAVLFDPELIGIAMQRGARVVGRRVEDFQDLRSWRRLTIAGLRMTRAVWPNVVVPMAFSNAAYLQEIRDGVSRFEARVCHVCLIAPVEVVHERLTRRDGAGPDAAWAFRRAAECCAVHREPEFAVHVLAAGRTPEEIANEILGGVDAVTGMGAPP
jgi:predicted kinase